MSKKLRGLIIRETNVGEADKILTVLTHELGKISILAKNVRRSKSRLTAGARFLCYSDFVVNEGRNFYYLSQCYPVEYFFSISEHIEKLALATYLGQLTAELVPDCLEDDGALSLLLNTFYLLSKTDKNLKLVKAAFELRIMAEEGYLPSVEQCAKCGKLNEPMMFDIKQGSLICSQCGGRGIPLSVSAVQAVCYILYCDKKKLYSFETGAEVLAQLSQLAEEYVLFHTGKSFQSLSYLKLFLD